MEMKRYLCLLAILFAFGMNCAVGFEVWETSIQAIRQGLESGQIGSCVELTKLSLQRIAAYEGTLNALVTSDSETSLIQAQFLDNLAEELMRTKAANYSTVFKAMPLFCIPTVLKDNYNFVPHDRSRALLWPTTVGSITLASQFAKKNSALADRLVAAGVVVLGKANMAEFAFDGINTNSSVAGQTRNSYNLSVTPFGSSGGSATAAAASFGVFAMGSDTQGSIQNPSAAQSLYGLRGTANLFPTRGIYPLSAIQDVAGPMCRNVEDLAIVLTVMGRPPLPDTFLGPIPDYTKFLNADSGLRGVRLGFLQPEGKHAVTAEVAKACDQVLHTASNAGATIVDLSNTEEWLWLAELANSGGSTSFGYSEQHVDWNYFLQNETTPESPAHNVTTLLEKLEANQPSEPQNVVQSVRNIVAADPPYVVPLSKEAEAYRNAQTTLQHIIELTLLNHDLDGFIYPTMSSPPTLLGQRPPFLLNYISASSGYPSLVIPAGYSSTGLPIGMTMLARKFHEGSLISWASALQLTRTPSPLTPPLNS